MRGLLHQVDLLVRTVQRRGGSRGVKLLLHGGGVVEEVVAVGVSVFSVLMDGA